MPLFVQLHEAVRNTTRNGAVYRLAISGPKRGFRGNPDAIRYDVVVQFKPSSRHVVPYGPGFHGWDTTGFPEHSTDAWVTGTFGGNAVEDGMFPWRVLGTPPFPYGSVLAIAVPFPDGGYGHIHEKGAVYPTFRYPDKYRNHVDIGSPFPLSHVVDWEQYFAGKILESVLSQFGQTRPNLNNPGTAFRLVYVPAHNAFAIQHGVGLDDRGKVAWRPWDGQTGEAFFTSSYTDPVFGWGYRDYVEGEQLYPCQTVLGIHFETTSFTLDQYDYDRMAHDRRTGGVNFENTDCEGRPGDPSRRELAACGGCVIAYSEPSGGARARPLPDLGLGFNTTPEADAEITGVDGAKLDNQIITNWHLCNIREALCAINANLGVLINAVDDFKAVFDARMMELIMAIQNIRLNVDTSGVEQAIRDHTSSMVDLWEIRP